MIEYNEQLAKETERTYLMPEIANQRARILATLQPQAGEWILDAGCGMGLLAREIALAVGPEGRVVGVDNSGPMIAMARERCGELSQVEIRQQAVDSLHEPGDRFDAVTCIQLLLYVNDVRQTVAELVRVLHTGGRIAIVETDWRGVLFNTQDDKFTRVLFERWESSIPSPHLPGQLRRILRQFGLSHLRVEAIPIINTCYLPDSYSASMVNYMLRSELNAGRISESDADAYRSDLQRRSDAGDYFFCVNRYLFTAVKK